MQVAALPIFGWTDGYVVLKHHAEELRGAVTINPGTDDWERWPRTTGSDVVTIAAFFDMTARSLAPDVGGFGIRRRWLACLADLELHAVPMLPATYRENRRFWRTLAALSVHLASVDAPLPPTAAWQALLTQLERDEPRNVDLRDLAPFGPFDPHIQGIDDLYIAQWKRLREMRGVDEMTPDNGVAGARLPIPRATNDDVFQLAAYWTTQLWASKNAHGAQLGSAEIEKRWRITLYDVTRNMRDADPYRVYPQNNSFFRSLDALVVHIAAVADVKTATRNAIATEGTPFGPFPGVEIKELDDLYIAQWKYLREKRGEDRMAPDPGTSGPTQPIPRATNGDVVLLADYWGKHLAQVRQMSGHADVKARWDAAIADVTKLARGADPNAVYPKNNAFFRALDAVVIQVASVVKLPSDWDRAWTAVKHSVQNLPENLGKAAEVIAGGASNVASKIGEGVGEIAGKASSGFFSGIKVPLLVGGGLVGAYLLLRSSRKEGPRA